MKRLAFVILLLVLASTAVSAQTTTYPLRTDRYVNDYANVIDDKYETSIRALLETAWTQTNKDITLITINRINQYAEDSTLETFATALFNYWAIDDAETNDGVLILAVMDDRKIRIEVGSGYGVSMDVPMQIVLDEYILPKFRRGDYGAGFYDGAKEVIRSVTGITPSDTLPQPSFQEQIVSTVTDVSQNAQENPVPFLGIPALGIGGAVVAWRRYTRYRPRKCPSCGQNMVRLDESSDDRFLEKGQVAEENIQSIDYDVWECPSCQTHSIFDYKNHFSGKKQCPQCSYHTVVTQSTVLTHATKSSTGLRLVKENCQHCQHQREYEQIIPRVTSSSSSGSRRSSSGGGGGSSSGGGASGSW